MLAQFQEKRERKKNRSSYLFTRKMTISLSGAQKSMKKKPPYFNARLQIRRSKDKMDLLDFT